MSKTIAIRVGESLVALLLMSLVIFLLSRVTGDPVALMLGDGANEADRQALIARLGLDQSWFHQYFSFIGNALSGDFGRSLTASREPALQLVWSRLPASLSLAGVALVFTLIVGIALGVLAAVSRSSGRSGRISRVAA